MHIFCVLEKESAVFKVCVILVANCNNHTPLNCQWIPVQGDAVMIQDIFEILMYVCLYLC